VPVEVMGRILEFDLHRKKHHLIDPDSKFPPKHNCLTGVKTKAEGMMMDSTKQKLKSSTDTT
jgi:hypothetical protein